MRNGDIVKVIVEHPDGSTVETYGTIGVIARIEHFVSRPNETDYTVHTLSSDYVYEESQIREATPAEIKEELRRILTLKGG